MKQFCVNIQEWVLAELAEIAKQDDRDRNYIINKIFEEYIKNHETIELNIDHNLEVIFKKITVIIEDSLYSELKKIAYEKYHCNISLFIRAILMEYVCEKLNL